MKEKHLARQCHRLGTICLTALACAHTAFAQETPKDEVSLWQEGIGMGFQSGVQTFTLQPGVNIGLVTLGSMEAHHLALVSFSYGLVLSPVMSKGSWCAGNWEIRGELFGGSQFDPEGEWLVGLSPHLRYNFVTGSKLVPFVDIGAGLTATSIGPPDLSNVFEFNLQAGAGCHWFFREDLALTVEARFLHLSCAGISEPNLGLNGVMAMLGLTWLF